MAQDFYGILGVAHDADAAQIARAFRHLVRTLHPDAAAAPTTRIEADADAERLAQVVAAWRVLHDPAKRAAYDRSRIPSTPVALERPGRGGKRSTAPGLVAGPAVSHVQSAPRPGPHLRVGPPLRLDE